MPRKKKNAWERPPNSVIPNRTGDLSPDRLYYELGRSVSSWEGVEAALCLLLESAGSEISEIIHYSTIRASHERAKYVEQSVDFRVTAAVEIRRERTAELRRKLKSILDRYRGWVERRNDLAHGSVTEATSPDYSQFDQPLVSNWSLCPSHARYEKWGIGPDVQVVEPEYNFLAEDVELFRRAFEKLSDDMGELSAEVFSALN